MLSLTLQYALVAVAVLVSAWVVMRKQFPGATRRLLIACAVPCVRQGRPAWLQAFGRWIAPPASVADACGGCSGCEPKP